MRTNLLAKFKIPKICFNSHFNCIFLFLLLNQSVIVQWLPNKEKDLTGYKVYYGNASRSYSKVIAVGRTTECKINNLQSGMKYFFAVTAYDTVGNESPFSEEVSIAIANDDNIVDLDDHSAYNYPNPFRPGDQITRIRYYMYQAEAVTIAIFDIKGNKIRSLLSYMLKSSGEHTEDVWDGRDDLGNFVPNGIYIAKVSSQSATHYITIAVLK
ncbi:MAG: fibronectin type III domain-containing protein [candidate division KSB1 bacterium]|nr:fibronectin type III domain-containing protein [candidate division KSB1 bacterium]